MTDDRANLVDSQLQSKQTQNIPSKDSQSTGTQAPNILTQKTMPNNSNSQNNNVNSNVNNNKTTNSTVSSSAAKPENAPEPQIKKVDVAIAGVTYPIYCPVHEQEELHAAVSYINDFALKLRKEAPGLSQENLLVLSCLNLYEKIQTHERNEEDRLQQSKQSDALLNKIMQDAHSIL